jgi:energy-coupling factor transporter transmembrane protein EcfT
MECRCYRGDKNRTKLVKLEYRVRDFVLLAAFVLLLILIIAVSIVPYKLSLDGIIFDILLYRI